MIKDKSLKEYKGWQLPKELKINENIGTLKIQKKYYSRMAQIERQD